jgi:hypothetical protein
VYTARHGLVRSGASSSRPHVTLTRFADQADGNGNIDPGLSTVSQPGHHFPSTRRG